MVAMHQHIHLRRGLRRARSLAAPPCSAEPSTIQPTPILSPHGSYLALAPMVGATGIPRPDVHWHRKGVAPPDWATSLQSCALRIEIIRQSIRRNVRLCRNVCVVEFAWPLCSGEQRRSRGGRHGCKADKYSKRGGASGQADAQMAADGTQDACVLALLQRMRWATLLQRYFATLLMRIFDKKQHTHILAQLALITAAQQPIVTQRNHSK